MALNSQSTVPCGVQHWLEGIMATKGLLLPSTGFKFDLGRFAQKWFLYIQELVEGNIINLHANGGSKHQVIP